MSNYKHTPGPWATDIETAAELVKSEGDYDRNTFRRALDSIANDGLNLAQSRKAAREALENEASDARIDGACVYVDHGSGKGSQICSFPHDIEDGLDITDAETKANARLAAASPRLLEILDTLFRRVGESQNITRAHMLVNDARAQLAKLLPE